MIYKLGSAALVAFYLCAQGPVALTQDTQSTGSTQTSPSGVQKTSTGEKTVTGCVAREGEQFVLKTDSGTYAFDTARDLSSYVGKKVRISGRWKATGVTTAAPVQGASAASGTSAGAAESTSGDHATGAKSAPAAKSFVGDLHLHITGDVIGDCESPK